MYDDCLERIKKRDEYIGILERIEKETKGEVENVSNH
jgi:hypothetical protein